MRNAPIVLAHLLFLSIVSTSAPAGDWPQFRGPRGDGICDEADVPLTWGPEENVRWRAVLPGPGNNGSPIVSRGCVFIVVATDEGHHRSLHCYDRRTGEERWVRTVTFDGKEPTHGKNKWGGTTPVADGQRVIVWHSSAGMHCYDYDGNALWSRDLGPLVHIWGYGASPVIHGDLVFCNCGPGERQRLVALDKRSGEVVWEAPEPGGSTGEEKPWIGSWSTPVVAEVDGREQVLLSFPHHLNAYDPGDGSVLWQCGGLGNLVYTTPVVSGKRAVVMSGFTGPAIGLELGGSGDVTETNRLWRVEKNPQRIGSGVILGENMFMVNEPGIAECFDVASGESRWRLRLPGGGHAWSSLTYAAGRLYVTTQTGETVVFAADPEGFEILASNPLNEPTNSTIAISDGEIFLRTYKALYCIDRD